VQDKELDEQLTDQILREVETSEGDEQARQSAVSKSGSTDPLQVLDNVEGRKATIESLEREANDIFEQIKAVKQAVEEREADEEFQQYLDDNAVDAEDYKRLRQLLDRYEHLIAKLTIEREIAWDSMNRLSKIVDEQKMRNDEREIINKINDFQDMQKDNLDRMLDVFEKSVNKNAELFESAARSMEQAADRLAEREDKLLEVFDSVELNQEAVGEVRRHAEQDDNVDMDAFADNVEVDRDLSELNENEQEILEYLERGHELSTIAQQLGMKKDRVDEIQSELVEDGYHDPE